MVHVATTEPWNADRESTRALLARVTELEAKSAAREERVQLLEAENRWLKAQLFGRSSERAVPEAPVDPNTPQGWLFNEAEALASAAAAAPESVAIPAHERARRGRKPLPDALPRVEVVHDLADADKVCPLDGTPMERIGEETSEHRISPASAAILAFGLDTA